MDYCCRSIAFGARILIVYTAKSNGIVGRHVKRNAQIVTHDIFNLFQRECTMKRNIYLTTILVILTAMIVSGCATMQSIDVNARSRTFDADYSATLKAAVDYLNSDGWQIATVDKDLGLINTEFKSVSGLAAILSGEERYKINFSIQKQSAAQTKVIANMLYEKKSGGNASKSGEWTQANMTEGKAIDKYNEILNGVQLKIIK